MPDHEVRAHVDECLEEACLRAVQENIDEKIIGALLSHREQRFRLSYVLGGWKQTTAGISEDEFSFDDEDTVDDAIAEDEAATEDEISRNRERLEDDLGRIKRIAAEVAARTADSLGELPQQKEPEEKAAWLEIFGEALYEHEDFSRLALDIMDEIEDRFERIEEGAFKKGATGWPVVWTIASQDRADFLKQVRWFSSNHHAQFGRLLTPLVDGVRVRGAFHPIPEALRVAPKLVLLDGEGIGHSAKAASSISTRVTRRFSEADLILIVDNAEQPMQSAPLELLRSIGSSGHADKIAVVFTHFDLVKGPNLGNQQLKRDHVLNSVRDAIGALRQSLGAPVAALLEERIESGAFFLGGLDREIGRIPKGFKNQIRDLLSVMQESGAPVEPVEAAPIYRVEGLEHGLRPFRHRIQLPARRCD